MNVNIIGASIFGLLLVGSAIFYTSKIEEPSQGQQLATTSNVIGKTIPVRNYIATTDTDADGTPDWQKSLAEIQNKTVTRTERIIPETLTEEFAVDVLDLYINAYLYNYTEKELKQQEELTSNILVERAKDVLYTVGDITVSKKIDTGALRAYGNRIAVIALTYDVPEDTRDILEIVSDAIISGNRKILYELLPTRDAYKNIVDDLLTVNVPLIYIQEHLNLLNTINALAIDMTIMSQTFEDPIYAELRLKRYDEDVLGMNNAISDLYIHLNSDGVTWRDTDAVLQFVTIEQ